ncbi:AAA family ATPase [Bradyrhizobium sp. B120]|uniref:AAA family ATPase n=1 Tax=Bradyrhizobium sp. B120 TaxID=3410088 RepID=UPI003B97DBA7
MMPQLKIINPVLWRDQPVPEREWIVRDWIPAKTVSLLSGDGAVGKSTLALQLGAARALDRDWIGTMPAAGRTLYLSAEDDANELHRRLDAIRVHYGVTFDDLSDLEMVDLVGENAVLGEIAKTGIINPTPVFDAVVSIVERRQADLVIVDALADAFAGDENNRSQARQFIGMLKRPARAYGCAFLCLAHPSLYGLNTGTGSSGSTAWNNSVRSRLYFEPAKATNGTEPDPSLRSLSVQKTNYGPKGRPITLRWTAGAYVPEGGAFSLDRMALKAKAETTFLDLLRQFNTQGQDVSAKPCSTYAPKVFAEHPKAEGIGKALFVSAMQNLLDSKKVKIETTGSPSRQRSRLVIEDIAA